MLFFPDMPALRAEELNHSAAFTVASRTCKKEGTSCQDGPAEKGLNMKLGWLLIFPGIPLLFALVASLVMAIVNYVLCPEALAAVFGGPITFNKAACLTLLLCLPFFRVHRA